MPPRKKPQAPRPKPSNTGRCSKEEKRGRITAMLTLARNGWSTSQMQDYAMDEFNLTELAAANLVNESLEANVEAYVILDRRRLAALTLARFENSYRLAASQRNPSAMIAANSQIAQHWVQRAPDITVSGGKTADAHDSEEDF